MVMIDLVMWDLDETLLPSQHLRDARHRSSPCELSGLGAFAGTALHPGISDAVLGMTGVRTGLVTSSPRWYVEQLLDCFLPQARFDVLVTYEDVQAIKPDPEPLLDPGEFVAIMGSSGSGKSTPTQTVPCTSATTSSTTKLA